MGRSRTSRPLALAGAGLLFLAIATIVQVLLRRPAEPGRDPTTDGRIGAGTLDARADGTTELPADVGGETGAPSPAGGDATLASGSLRLEGRVAFPDGDPVAGARVSLGAEEGWVRWGNRPPSTVTAEDGAFALRGLAPDLYEVTVERPGVARIVFRGIRVERANLPPFELVVERGAVLAGRVVGDDGQGVADVEVTAWPQTFGRDANDLPRPKTRTDGTGTFRFDTLARVPHGFSTDTKDPYTRRNYGIPWAPDRDGVVLRLTRGAILAGRVVDARTGRGIEGAALSLGWTAASDRSDGSSGGGSSGSGPDGSFRWCLDAPCSAVLSVENPGYRRSEPLSWQRLEPGEVIDGLEVRLEPAEADERPPLRKSEVEFSGSVVDEGGHPVASSRVILGDAGMCAGGRGGNFHRGHSEDALATTEADGSFHVRARCDNRFQTWLLRAEHPEGGVSAPLEVSRDDAEADRAGVRLSIEPAGVIVGIVTGPDDAPVADVGIELFRFHARCGAPTDPLGPEDAWGGRRAAETGPDGRFAFPLLEAAPCRLRVAGRGRLLAAPDRIVELHSGETVEVKIVLEEGQSISGTVVAADGTPIRGASVDALAEDEDEGTRGDSVASTISDQDGFYRIDALANGLYQVRAEVDGFPPEVRGSVESGSTGVDFAFEAPAEVEVSISDAADGSRVWRSTVEFVPVEVGASRTDAPEVVRSDRSSLLPPGTWDVRIESRGYLHWRLPEPVRLRPGDRLRIEAKLERGLSIAGTVVDAAAEPVHGARVAIRPTVRPAGEEKPRRRDETVVFTEEDGTFRATGFAPGTWRVDVRHADHGESILRVELGAPGSEGKPPDEGASLRIVLGGEGGE